MRYDTPIYFQTSEPVYDYSTGNYIEGTPTEVEMYASVVGTAIETMRLVYGEIRQGSKTITLQNRYMGIVDRIRIDDKVYSVDYRYPMRVKDAFVISEV